MGRDAPTSGLTYNDLAGFPDDGLRRELIGGQLVVTPAPATRHQRTVLRLARVLLDYADAHGGEPLIAPFDVKLTERDVVEPDVLFVRDPDRLGPRFLDVPPDLVVEVTSPATKRTDRIRKRALYERHGVGEYWIVDLEEEAIEVYALDGARYGDPVRVGPGDVLVSPMLRGFRAGYGQLVAPALRA